MPVDTIAVWMYFAITTVICGKVITGTVLNKQRKELATIHEKLRRSAWNSSMPVSGRKLPRTSPPSRSVGGMNCRV